MGESNSLNLVLEFPVGAPSRVQLHQEHPSLPPNVHHPFPHSPLQSQPWPHHSGEHHPSPPQGCGERAVSQSTALSARSDILTPAYLGYLSADLSLSPLHWML